MTGVNENGTYPSGNMQAPPPPPPYASYQTAGFGGRTRVASDEVIALISGSLAAFLILVSSFFRWIKEGSSFPLSRSSQSSIHFSGFMLILGLAILSGVALAYFLRERLAGGVFCIVISGALSLAGFSFAIAHASMAEGTTIGPGAYLGLAGGLLGLMSGLLFLSIRKRENMLIQMQAARAR